MSMSLFQCAAVGLALIACAAPQTARADGREHHLHVRSAPAHAARPPVRPVAAPATAVPARETVRLADSFFVGPLTGGVGFAYGAGGPPAPVAVLSRRR